MRRTLIMVAGVAGLVAGCGGGSDAGVVEIRGREYAYSLPNVVEGGWRTIRFRNEGKEEHDAILLRLDRGRTAAELQTYMKSPKAADGPPPWVTLKASIGAIPNRAVAVTQLLEAGTYVVACSVAGASGVPHFNLGMLAAFEVAGRRDGAPPTADAVIVLGNKIQVPQIEAGQQTIELRNEGNTDGGAIVYRLEPGATIADVERWIASGRKPAPASYVMGDLMAANTTAFYTTEFEAGRKYAIFNEATGAVTVFTVG